MHQQNAQIRVAVVQMDSRADVATNLAQADGLIRTAARRRAQLVALPENALYIGPDRRRVFTLRSPEVLALRQLARQLRIWLLVGSIPEAIPSSIHHYNSSLLFDPQGRLVARYRKIHRFRCRLPNGRWVRETCRAGTRAVVASTPWAKLGLTICYDLRMPELFGTLAQRGAQIIGVPSNFTAFTGTSHWHVLLRARAIENQAYVIAPAQCGRKYQTPSYGHALIVDPWGRILAEAQAARPAVLIHTMDLARLAAYRTQLPALRDRLQTRRYWR